MEFDPEYVKTFFNNHKWNSKYILGRMPKNATGN